MTTPLILPQNYLALAMINPLAGTDHGVATWFHAHLTRAFVSVLRAFTEFGSSEWIGVVLFSLVLFFVWKRLWPSLVTLIVAVPGGMLLNELVKVLPMMKGRCWRTLTVSSAALLIALVGFSRIALGAHFLTDVLAAIFFGIIWLAFCLIAGKPMRRSVVLTPDAPLVSEPVLVRVEETGPPAQSFLS